ncbi:MAG: nucleotide exchange factor GrpE [Pseudomonadota bacterium]
MAEQKHEQPQNGQDEALDANSGAKTEPLQQEGEAGPEAAEAAATEDIPEKEPSVEEIVAQLEQDAATAKDIALRAQAEAQNVKRRAEQDMEKARKFALEQFSKDLLAVVDNMERGLEAAAGQEGEAVKSISEGVELTLKSLLDVLKKHQVEPVDPQGEPFDPNLHQAMSMVENPDVEPNSVIAVMQKGYTLNGRLLRPAMVMVSKAAN